jgi:hypothetical protein
MGYGTTLTPVLILMGYPPILIVPTVLFSEFLTGVIAGGFHHVFGNISLRRGGHDLGIIIVLASTGVIGTLLAVVTAINIPRVVLKGYIGAMVLSMGVLVFIFRRHTLLFSWPRIVGVGIISAFNKGMSGGGYGPLVVSGQLLSGHGTRNAIGVASFAEGLICAVGFPLYLIMHDGAGWFVEHLSFYLPVVIGAILAAPVAAWTTKTISRRVGLRLIIALLTCTLGAWTLWKTFS